MAASSEMPYFIKPSRNLSSGEKRRAYAEARSAIRAILGDEQDETVKMVTINCLLKSYLPYFYWVGFYLVRGERKLVVGPYQGTLGCLYISFGRGVCGRVAESGEPIVVKACHDLAEGSEHIACDPNSRSEIVLPVRRADGSLLGVFDVDSTLEASFDDVDLEELGGMLEEVFG